MDAFKLMQELNLPAIIAVQALDPGQPLVIHRRKCKIQRKFRCTCVPTFVSPTARV